MRLELAPTLLLAGLLSIGIASKATQAAKITDCLVPSLNALVKSFDEDASLEDSWRRIQTNISRPDTTPGTVVAAVSSFYYYHWVRDAAITMSVVMSRLEHGLGNSEELLKLRKMMDDYAELSHSQQALVTRGGLGEPRFKSDGTPDNIEWARPQNDGPALRANVLTRYVRYLEKNVVGSGVFQKSLYATIRTDLDYIAHEWGKPGADLWEEAFGHHLYTRAVQHRALADGAELAQRLEDPARAKHYQEVADMLRRAIQDHWNASDRILRATLSPATGNMPYKTSQQDSATVLALLHSQGKHAVLRAIDDRMMSTVLELEKTFGRIYPINANHLDVPLIGRYPEDRYPGLHGENTHDPNVKGNPWVLTTNAFGEYYALLARDWIQDGKIVITERNKAFLKKLLSSRSSELDTATSIESKNPLFEELLSAAENKSQAFLDLTRKFEHSDGSTAEQINQVTGELQGAEELNWNFASRYTAIVALKNLRALHAPHAVGK